MMNYIKLWKLNMEQAAVLILKPVHTHINIAML